MALISAIIGLATMYELQDRQIAALESGGDEASGTLRGSAAVRYCLPPDSQRRRNSDASASQALADTRAPRADRTHGHGVRGGGFYSEIRTAHGRQRDDARTCAAGSRCLTRSQKVPFGIMSDDLDAGRVGCTCAVPLLRQHRRVVDVATAIPRASIRK